MEKKITVDFEVVKQLALHTTKHPEHFVQWWEGEPTDLDDMSLAMVLANSLVKMHDQLVEQIQEQNEQEITN